MHKTYLTQKLTAFSKYIFSTNPLALLWNFKKVSGKIRSWDLPIARDVFYHCTILQVEVLR